MTVQLEERACFRILGLVHTNADSFESVYLLIRLVLPSTLTRGLHPPNPYKFGNALESELKRIRISFVLVWTVGSE